jgi:hypothetical protein
MTVGGVDTYYDYDERQWKYRRLGGGPVRPRRARPDTDRQADAGAFDTSYQSGERTSPAAVRDGDRDPA